MNIIDILKSRYSTKEFDPTKKLSNEELDKITDLLQLAPSSTNIQPWHFIIITSDEGKQRLESSTQGIFKFNGEKLRDSSAVIIFCTLAELTDEYLMELLEKEDKDGRFSQAEFKEQNHQGRKMFSEMHKYDFKDFQGWAENQVYINLGNFLLGVAALGIDALAMEGVDMKELDKEFSLNEKGYTASVVVAVGFHKESDFNKDIPKSRLSKDRIIEIY